MEGSERELASGAMSRARAAAAAMYVGATLGVRSQNEREVEEEGWMAKTRERPAVLARVRHFFEELRGNARLSEPSARPSRVSSSGAVDPHAHHARHRAHNARVLCQY